MNFWTFYLFELVLGMLSEIAGKKLILKIFFMLCFSSFIFDVRGIPLLFFIQCSYKTFVV